jgi:hypothetical protein
VPDPLKKVISASRRIELPGFFPDRLADFLSEKCRPERVHSVVIWSKDPKNLIEHPRLRGTLELYDQIFLHWTITGMGGSLLEPGIPSVDESLSLVPRIVEWIGSPRRVRIRFDPVVHVIMPDGNRFTNLDRFTAVAEEAKRFGVDSLVTSWMDTYRKVVSRLRKYGIEIVALNEEARKSEENWMLGEAERIGVRLMGCCVPGLPSARCIDGGLLTELHPRNLQADVIKAKDQRPQCGCTASWDIGWYLPCPGGCLYCYANPKEAPAYNTFGTS